ncbi:cellulose synthase complex periplasmic endoglucanase BcsZ [Pseudomonas putida]|uniref:cellulose synthase complex periplasmic endoglucanase BcsZ n=1 Tax=Pseudomonas putida TaxID=303 RepID=UPI00370B2534
MSRLKAWLGGCLLLVLSSTLVQAAPRCDSSLWPLWQTFREHFVQPDGRVLDASTPQQHSSSEGQSYAMFFALVANDRSSFDLMWRWAQNNLAGGDIAHKLPGWFWGKDEQGVWRLLDDNSASDADLWFAYALFEAGRLWQDKRYTEAARQLLTNIKAQEIETLPGLGKMLMPGFRGFIKPDLKAPNLWQLNPSYLPVPLLRRLAVLDAKGPWSEIANNTLTLMQAVGPKGFIADWVSYRASGADQGQFIVDPVKGELGSYDAIRVYLWAGVTAAEDPLARPMLAATHGMSAATAQSGVPPEKIQTQSGALSGQGGFGFSAALLPYFQALGDTAQVDAQTLRFRQGMAQSLTPQALKAAQPPYYHFVLSLFALGHMEQRYRMDADGLLQTAWGTPCARLAP